MPIDIEGWIEVRNTETQKWNGAQSISSYMIYAGEESDLLFGITKISRAGSIAANRGLPEDISQETKENLDGYREFEKEESNFSFDELFGFSYITYEEILKHDLVQKFRNGIGWDLVFGEMESIRKNTVKAENIRVVVWANW